MLFIPYAALHFRRGGVTAFKSDEELMQNKWLFNCFKRLMIPYFIWTIIYCLINRRVDFLNALFFNPELWYLINLFLCDVILFISVHSGKMKYITSISIYIFFFFLYMLFRDGNLVIKNVDRYFLFYLVGHIIFRSKDKTWVKYMKKYLWVGALLYPVSMRFYTFDQYNLVITKIQNLLGITSYGGMVHMVALFYNHFVVASLGIMFVWFFVELLSKLNTMQKPTEVVARVGRYTMFIYILEGLTSYVIDGNFMNNVFLSGILLVLVRMAFPLAIAYILSFMPKLRVVLFGQ